MSHGGARCLFVEPCVSTVVAFAACVPFFDPDICDVAGAVLSCIYVLVLEF